MHQVLVNVGILHIATSTIKDEVVGLGALAKQAQITKSRSLVKNQSFVEIWYFHTAWLLKFKKEKERCFVSGRSFLDIGYSVGTLLILCLYFWS